MQHAEALQTTRSQFVLARSFVGIPRHTIVARRGTDPCQRHEAVSVSRAMQHNGVAFLEDFVRLATDDGLALAIFAAVVVAAVLAFYVGATPDIVASVLVLGVLATILENKLRAKNMFSGNTWHLLKKARVDRSDPEILE